MKAVQIDRVIITEHIPRRDLDRVILAKQTND